MSSLDTPQTLTDVIRSFRRKSGKEAFRYRTQFRTFSWTYPEAFRNALKLCQFLRNQDVDPGQPVMVWAPNSPAWVWVYLGCILNRSPLVPIDMGSHPNFVENVRQETDAQLLFTSRVNDSLNEPIPVHQIEDFVFPEDHALSEASPHRPDDADEVAEIIYTSGTTGTPKGTILTHRNLVANQNSLIEYVADVVDFPYHFLSLLPLSHAFEQTVGFWLPVRTEGTISYLQTLKPSEIFDAFQTERPDMVVAVPRFLSLFRDQILRKAEDKGKKKSLRSWLSSVENWPRFVRRTLFRRIINGFGGELEYFIVGGAPLESNLEQFWTNIGVPVFQGYGLTETGPVLTCNMPTARKAGSVGRALPDVELRTDDKDEILARGDNVFPGYYQREELNEEVFADGWFRTGDLGEIDENGFLTLKGRKTNMIVTDEGLNVYPEDIEEVLNKSDHVKDSCVLDLNDRITAVLLPASEDLNTDHLIEDANRELSSAQQIQDTVIWPGDDFPRTTTLKIRRMEVREELEDREPDAGQDSPVTEVGDTLLRVLGQVSDVPADEIEEDQQLGSDLGLSSVDRLELVTLIEQKKYVDLEEQKVTSSTTVAELRELVAQGAMGDEKDKFRRWTRNDLCTAGRLIYQNTLASPLLRLYCRRLDVSGREHLQGLDGPCVFIANHTSHLDAAAILDGLPGPFDTRLAVAAWEEFFERGTDTLAGRLKKQFLWNFTTICYNIFPIPQSRGFRKSMSYIGELLDDDWNVLFFPEGQRSIDGNMNPFRRGIGVIAREMRVPIVPIRLDGLEDILPRGADWPREGTARMQFGEPIENVEHDSYDDISNHLWNVIHNMKPSSLSHDVEVPVTFYETDDCPLCHKAKQKIAQYQNQVPFDLELNDIESDPEMYDKYKNAVPVVFVDGTLASKGKFNERRFERLLNESYDERLKKKNDT